MGNKTRPARVGENPVTSCRYSERKKNTLHMTARFSNASTLAAATFGMRNSDRSTNGAADRRSATTKIAALAAAIASIAHSRIEVHPRLLVCVSASTSANRPIADAMRPTTSTGARSGRRAGRGLGSAA
ncbi:hypothetical protein Mspyr1_54730 (plasmid) [Mycolicibacterium gilvum Spyr1]|uniref:Uncharacterized protein n=1 Tax=Mycolicibacterium gilvum (strain DSM 45189 / LMG 24558 / Spyr1) TaxID=278137 RepID=E6TQ61_MYCSR|nr:hypothetical protein Mspyr1_54730 [Mycolicibacterium gilvum Spyr1]